MGAIADFKELSCMTDLLSWLEDNVAEHDMALELANHICSAVDMVNAMARRWNEPIRPYPFTYKLTETNPAGQPVKCVCLMLKLMSGEVVVWIMEFDEHEQVNRVSLSTIPVESPTENRTLH